MNQSTTPPSGFGGRGEPQDRPLSAVEIELNRKRMLRDQVRERFARYGQTVCDLISHEMQQPRGLNTLILQLGLRVSASSDNMLASLTHYLAIHGAEAMLARVRGGGPRPELSGQIPLEQTPGQSPAPTPLSGRIELTESAPARADLPMINIPGVYSGPERRVGQERRNGNRRNELEAIMKNRRYGVDRRQHQRRSTDKKHFH